MRGKILCHTPPSLSPKKREDGGQDPRCEQQKWRSPAKARQRKACPEHPKLHKSGERHRPESTRIRPFQRHPSSNPSALAAPSSTLEPVRATSTPVTRPRIPRNTRFPGRKAAPQTGRHRGQHRGNTHQDRCHPARDHPRRAPRPRVPLYSARRLSVTPTALARPRLQRPLGPALRWPTLTPEPEIPLSWWQKE